MSAETVESAAVDAAAAPLGLLLTDAALGVLNRVNLGGSGLRNPLLRRVRQGYLAAAQTAEGLAQDADLDWADRERAGFVLTNMIDALAPSNNPVLNRRRSRR